MAFADEFSDMLNQTIVWEKVTSRDSYGKPTYGAPVLFAPPNGGRRVYKIKRVAGFSRAVKGEGTDVISDSQITILAAPVIGWDDRVYVQGDTLFPPIVSITQYPDETGVAQYTEVDLGNANG